MTHVDRVATVWVDTGSADAAAAADAGSRRWSRQRWADTLFGFFGFALLATALFQNFFRLPLAPVLVDEPLYAGMGWSYVHWNSLSATAQAPIASNGEHPPLAKLLFGAAELMVGAPSLPAARAVSAACTVAAAVAVAWWLGLTVNRWLGLLAGSMLALIPMSVYPQVTRLGRAAMLEPVAGFFMVISIVIGWYWFRTASTRSWLLAAAAGMAVGLGSASKVNVCLGLVGPVVLGIATSLPSVKMFGIRLAQTLVAVLLAVATFLACYAPLGDSHRRIQYMIDFQSQHAHDRHPVALAGRLMIRPEWWANLWFAGQGIGTALSWAVPLTALAAVVLRRDRLVAWCVASLVAPFIFHFFVAGVVLPFYWVMWTPAVVALSAMGIWELLTRAASARLVPVRLLAGAAASVAIIAVLMPTVAQLAVVATLKPEGARAASIVRTGLGLQGLILSAGNPVSELRPFLGSAILVDVPSDLRTVDTILLGEPRCGQSPSPQVRALVERNLRAGTLRLARSDRLMRVYVVVAPLQAPTAAQIARHPWGRPAANC